MKRGEFSFEDDQCLISDYFNQYILKLSQDENGEWSSQLSSFINEVVKNI